MPSAPPSPHVLPPTLALNTLPIARFTRPAKAIIFLSRRAHSRDKLFVGTAANENTCASDPQPHSALPPPQKGTQASPMPETRVFVGHSECGRLRCIWGTVLAGTENLQTVFKLVWGFFAGKKRRAGGYAGSPWHTGCGPSVALVSHAHAAQLPRMAFAMSNTAASLKAAREDV